jgi:hypothetical protein
VDGSIDPEKVSCEVLVKASIFGKIDGIYVENVPEATGVLVYSVPTIDSTKDSSSNSLSSLWE